VTVRAGTADSVVVLGSDGQRVQTITITDRRGPAHETVRRASNDGSEATIPHLVLVKPGDSLWAIARRLVGPRASNAAVQRRLFSIWHANARRIGTGDPSLIYPGIRLHV
jgi:nucleoid-associated protein YgaU